MNKLATFLAATTLAAGGMVIVLWQQLHAERARAAQPRDLVIQPGLAQASMPTQQATFNAAPGAALKGTLATVVQPPPANVAANSATPPQVVLDLSKDPELCSAQKTAMRAQLPTGYPEVARVLGLSQSQSAALFDLLIRQQETLLDMSCSQDDARRRNQPSMASLLQSQQVELQALLGPVKYQQWQEYLPTLDMRRRLVQLRGMLSTGNIPLSDEQNEQLLTTLMAQEKTRREIMNSPAPSADPHEMLDHEEEKLRLLEESQERTFNSMQSFLASQQIAIQRSAAQRMLAIQRAQLRARRTQLDANGNADPAAAPR